MVNFIQTGKGIYLDCAENQELKGKLMDYRFDTDNNSIRRVQCYLCGKHTQIFVQDVQLKKTYEYTFMSTRPACPICGLGTLTGSLRKREGIGYVTNCENIECISTSIFLDENWEVTGAITRHGGVFVAGDKEE